MSPTPTTSHQRSRTRMAVGIGAIALAAGIGAFGAAAIVNADEDDAEVAFHEFEVEVAEDATRFVFDEAPVFDDGNPAYGNPFVTQGYIYEPGTLADGGGVNDDGSPTHPEAVLGTWTCEGFFVGDGALTETGPWVITTQVFDFEEFDGTDTIVTHGIEISDIDESAARAVVGGTGEYLTATGSQEQTLTGFNDSLGVNLEVTFELRPS